MIDTAKELISQDVARETIGSHGDLPPMTDEGRRAELQDQYATWQSSEPKPISQSREKWADIEYTNDEDDPHCLGCMPVSRGEPVQLVRSRCQAVPVADQSLPCGAGASDSDMRIENDMID